MRRMSALASGLVVVALAVTGCSSTATPSATATSVAVDPITVTVAEDGKTVTMTPGQAAIINIDTEPGVDVFVESSAEDVVTVEQAEGTGKITASPSIIAQGPGTATITVQLVDDSQDAPAQTALTFTVEVPGQG